MDGRGRRLRRPDEPDPRTTTEDALLAQNATPTLDAEFQRQGVSGEQLENLKREVERATPGGLDELEEELRSDPTNSELLQRIKEAADLWNKHQQQIPRNDDQVT